MIPLKTLSEASIPSALKKAERYRLLGEPYEAQSICLDILDVAPDNQEALIMLILAYTDEFKTEIYPAFNKAVDALQRLGDTHCRSYYRGIINERRAKAQLDRGGHSSGHIAHDWYMKAMADYETAMAGCAANDADAALRWNTCARILNENPHIKPEDEHRDVEVSDAYE